MVDVVALSWKEPLLAMARRPKVDPTDEQGRKEERIVAALGKMEKRTTTSVFIAAPG
jgi:hypothetical protein